MTLRRYHYLESLDSAASAWVLDADGTAIVRAGSEHEQEIHELQVFLEVLMTLALGKDVVVPQSYALDSWGFLNVAQKVLAARDAAEADNDHPFQLHLRTAMTYDEAAADMLRRIADPDDPMVTSLYPQLQGAHRLTRLPTTIEELISSGGFTVDDPRFSALKVVRREFSALPTVAGVRGSSPVDLSSLLRQMVDPGSRLTESLKADPSQQGIHTRLVDAIRRLDPSNPVAFRARSRLRMDQPWPGNPGRRTPHEIVGDDLDVVIEFVDTLYNAVTAGSIGIAPVTFTTDVTISGEHYLDARALAQRLALAAYSSGVDGSVPVLGLDPQEEQRQPSQFELRFESGNALVSEDVKKQLRLLAQEGAEGLKALFVARRVGRDGQKRSKFWRGLGQLDRALASRDQARIEAALKEHLDTVSRILHPHVKIFSLSDLKVKVAVGVGTIAGAAASTVGHVPELLTAGIGATGPLAVPLVERARSWSHGRNFANAVNEVVDISALRRR